MSLMAQAYKLKKEREDSKLSSVTHDTELKKLRIADAGGTIPKAPSSDEGFLFKFLNTLDRPDNALRNAIHYSQQGLDPLVGLKRGFSNKEKVFFSDILGHAGMEPGVARGVTGFLLDAAVSPLNIIGGGVVKAGAKGVAKATGSKLAKEVAEQGLLVTSVKAPLRTLDKGLTMAGVDDALKFKFAGDTAMQTTGANVVRKVAETPVLKPVAKAYVKAADTMGDLLSPSYTAKNLSPAQVGRSGTYSEIRENLQKNATDALLEGKRMADNMASTALRQVVDDVAGVTPQGQKTVVELLEDFPRRVERIVRENPYQADDQTLNLLARMAKSGTGFRQKVLESVAETRQALSVQGLTDKKIEALTRKQDRLLDALGEHDRLVMESEKYLKGWMAKNANTPEGVLYQKALKRMEDMAMKEGLTEAGGALRGYMPHYVEKVTIGDRGVTRTQLNSSRELRNALNLVPGAHKRRTILTTAGLQEAAQNSWGEARTLTKSFLNKEGAKSGLAVGKRQKQYDKLISAGKTKEAQKLLRNFDVEDMVEAINRGLDPSKLPPLYEVAETFGEAMIQREIQHAQTRASQMIVDGLRKNGLAIEDVPNAKQQLRHAEYVIKNLQGAPMSANTQKALADAMKTKADMESFLRLRSQFRNAGNLGLTGAENMLVHPQVAQVLDRMGGTIALSKSLTEVSGLYKSALSVFKQSVTGLNPGWYVTNGVGNVFNAYLAGVRDPRLFSVAWDMQLNTAASNKRLTAWLASKKIYSLKASKQGRKAFMDAGELRQIISKQGLEGFGTMFDNIGRDLAEATTSAQRKLAMEGMGAGSKAVQGVKYMAEDVAEHGAWKGLNRGARKIADSMETNTKVAVFLDNYVKKAANNTDYGTLKAMTRGAREHAFKYLFDYSDITNFEAKVMKGVAPFYTFARKNIPLQFDELLKQPGTYMGMHRAREGSLNKHYTEEQRDQMPEWLRERAIAVGNDTLLTPNMPSESIDDFLSPRVMSGMVTPFVTKFYEMLANQNLFTGAPIQQYEGQTKKLLGMDVHPYVRHLADTHGVVRGFNQATENWGQESDKLKAVEMLPMSAVSRAVGRKYNPDVNELNYMYGVDRQLADAIKALRDKGVAVRTATEIKKDPR